MTDNEAKEFLNRCKDYFNKNILPLPDCPIYEIVDHTILQNRGHGISLILKKDDGSSTNFGPTFYIEELLNDYKGHSETYIFEMIYTHTVSNFDEMINLYQSYAAQTNTTDPIHLPHYTEIPNDNFIWSIKPTAIVQPGELTNQMAYKTDTDTGMTIILKGCLKEVSNNQGYYGPISNKDVTEDVWNKAIDNMQRNTSFAINPYPHDKNIFIIQDDHKYFEYWYTTNLVIKSMYKDPTATFFTQNPAKTLYILPITPYDAIILMDNQSIANNINDIVDGWLKLNTTPLTKPYEYDVTNHTVKMVDKIYTRTI